MLSSLPVYNAMSSRPDSATARTTSSVWYRLNGAILMATTFSIEANARQNACDNTRPPTAGCK
jgi:hypothetical protein